jgi:5-methylcytosine-specific restriction endonuclease McrA
MPRKGYKQTKEHIERKLAWKDDPVKFKEANRKIGLSNKGRKLSPENKKKLNDSRRGKSISESHKRKIGAASAKMKRTPEMIERWASKQRGVPRPKIAGANNPNWRGGKVRNKTPGTYTNDEWERLKRRYKNICLCCHRSEPEIKLEKDHIWPVSLGGLNIIENIQPLCVACNRRKRDKIISYRVCRFRSGKRQSERLNSILLKKYELGLLEFDPRTLSQELGV